MPCRFQICIAKSLFSYRDDLPKNLFKIIAQECKKSTSGWRASLKMVAALKTSSINSRFFQKNGTYCAMHHPRRTLGSCWSPLIPWSWAIQWTKLLGLWQKANRSLNVIRRNLIKCPENVKEQPYLTLVRPQLALNTWMLRMGSAHSKTDKGHWECAETIGTFFKKMNIAQLLELFFKFLAGCRLPALNENLVDYSTFNL